MISTEQELWKRLLSLAPAHRKKPTKNLYDLLENSVSEGESKNTYSLALVKTYVENGHNPNQVWFNDLTPMVLATRNNDLELLKYFEQFAEDGNLNKGALNAVVEVIANNLNKPKELTKAYEILNHLLECSFDDLFVAEAFVSCVTQKQALTADKIVARHPGIRNVKIPIGPVETVSLESRLSNLSGEQIKDFIKILNGETLNITQLQEQYNHRQYSEERGLLDALFDDFDEQNMLGVPKRLSGDAWQSAYKELVQEIASGHLNQVLFDAHPNVGVSAFEFCAIHGLNDILDTILSNPGTVANLYDGQSYQAACCAATYGELDTLCILEKFGVDIANSTNCDKSPLAYACEYGHIDTVRYLLDRGARGDNKALFKLAGGAQRKQIITLLTAADTDKLTSPLAGFDAADHHKITFDSKEFWELRGETDVTVVFKQSAMEVTCTVTLANHYGPIADAMIYICPNPASDSHFELESNPEKPWLQGQVVEELVEVDEKMCSVDIAPALDEMEEHFWVKTFEVSYTHPGFEHLLKIMVVDPREFANNNVDDIYTSCLLEDILIPFKET